MKKNKTFYINFISMKKFKLFDSSNQIFVFLSTQFLLTFNDI